MSDDYCVLLRGQIKDLEVGGTLLGGSVRIVLADVSIQGDIIGCPICVLNNVNRQRCAYLVAWEVSAGCKLWFSTGLTDEDQRNRGIK